MTLELHVAQLPMRDGVAGIHSEDVLEGLAGLGEEIVVACPGGEGEPAGHVRVGEVGCPVAEDREGRRSFDDSQHQRRREGDASGADVDDDRIRSLLDEHAAQMAAAAQIELVRACRQRKRHDQRSDNDRGLHICTPRCRVCAAGLLSSRRKRHG